MSAAHGRASAPTTSSPYRWLILALGMFGQASACMFVYGMAFLLPQMRDPGALSLIAASTYVAAPSIGLLLTLIAWGALADRFGETRVIASGLLAAAAIAPIALFPDLPSGALVALLAIGGGAAGSSFAANGRLIMGWFPKHERGMAMGIRQCSQPLGTAAAGLTLPTLATMIGPFGVLGLPAALCAAGALCVLLFARDPQPGPASAASLDPVSPYRSPALWRVHAATALVTVPQFAFNTFTAEYLVRLQGWTPVAAGILVAVVQIVGAGSRVVSGIWSDRVGSRLRPMRVITVASVLVLVVFALGDHLSPPVALLALVIGGVVNVASTGLSYTAVAEFAGKRWSGRALGVQVTGQSIFTSVTPVALAALIGATGYGAAFLIAAAAPLAAIGIIPVRAEQRRLTQEAEANTPGIPQTQPA